MPPEYMSASHAQPWGVAGTSRLKVTGDWAARRVRTSTSSGQAAVRVATIRTLAGLGRIMLSLRSGLRGTGNRRRDGPSSPIEARLAPAGSTAHEAGSPMGPHDLA